MLKQFLYSLWVIVTFFVMLVPVATWALLVSWLPEKIRLLTFFRFVHTAVHIWGLVAGYRFVVHHPERLEGGPYVICPNHLNLLDMPAIGARFIHPFRPLAKSAFAFYPLLNVLYFAFCIGVNRKNAAHRRASQARMLKVLKRGISVMVFPEGTRNRTDEILQPFFYGAFHVAIEGQVPIVTVVQTGSRDLQPAGTYRFRPGTIDVHVLEPISTEGLTEEDVPALMEQVREAMLEVIVKNERQ